MPEQNLILLRLGAELAIKARRTRSSFLRQLRRNLRDALSTTDAPWQLEGEWSRIYVRSDSPHTPAHPRYGRAASAVVNNVRTSG